MIELGGGTGAKEVADPLAMGNDGGENRIAGWGGMLGALGPLGCVTTVSFMKRMRK